MPRVLGIDVASRSWADNGSAVLEFHADAVTQVTAGAIAWPAAALTPNALAAAIDAYARTHQICAVALDGPQGWRDPETPAGTPGVGRRCELACRTQGKTGTFGVTFPGTQRPWIEFAIALFDALLLRDGVVLANALPDALPRRGYVVLECFPTSAWRSSGLPPLPGKGKRPRLGPYIAALQEAYALPPFAVTSHDDLQAVVAALSAASVAGGPFTPLPRGVPAVEAAHVDGVRRRVEGIIWDVEPRLGPAATAPFARGEEMSGAFASAPATVRPRAATIDASPRPPRLRRGAVPGPAVRVTRGVLDQVQRSKNARAMLIALYGVPGGSKIDRRQVMLRIGDDSYELIVGDSHAAWYSHQNAVTLPQFEALFARLAERPDVPVAVTVATMGT